MYSFSQLSEAEEANFDSYFGKPSADVVVPTSAKKRKLGLSEANASTGVREWCGKFFPGSDTAAMIINSHKKLSQMVHRVIGCSRAACPHAPAAEAGEPPVTWGAYAYNLLRPYYDLVVLVDHQRLLTSLSEELDNRVQLFKIDEAFKTNFAALSVWTAAVGPEKKNRPSAHRKKKRTIAEWEDVTQEHCIYKKVMMPLLDAIRLCLDPDGLLSNEPLDNPALKNDLPNFLKNVAKRAKTCFWSIEGISELDDCQKIEATKGLYWPHAIAMESIWPGYIKEQHNKSKNCPLYLTDAERHAIWKVAPAAPAVTPAAPTP